MHPLIEKIIEKLSEDTYVVLIKSGEVVVWKSEQHKANDEDPSMSEDYLLAMAG